MYLRHDQSRKTFLKKDTLIESFYNDKEHYKLLSTVSKEYNNVRLYDIGTYQGLSALALSSNNTNLVISYDIQNYVEIERPENVELRLGNFYNDKELLNSPLIMFDIAPHNGSDERKFVDYLVQNNYKGTVIFDDIYLGDDMKSFWNSITQEKQDYTSVGHWSGTGVVHFK